MIISPLYQILLAAFILDVLVGEPPAAFHPVVWIGKSIKFLEQRSTGRKKLYGILMVILITGMAFSAGVLVSIAAGLLPHALAVLLAAFFLKSTFSLNMLLSSTRKIHADLVSGKLNNARDDLRALVGRSTGGLDESHIASAAIESVSENYVDGIAAPLFYYLILGLPGAFAYRAVNTLDSMVGYKNEKFIELGQASARLDDALNWIPARLSLLFIVIASLAAGNYAGAFKICKRDRRLTPSPNSGWPMAAASGALGVRLEKQGYYVLGGEFRQPAPEDIGRAVKLIATAALMLFLTILIALYIIY